MNKREYNVMMMLDGVKNCCEFVNYYDKDNRDLNIIRDNWDLEELCISVMYQTLANMDDNELQITVNDSLRNEVADCVYWTIDDITDYDKVNSYKKLMEAAHAWIDINK